MAARLIDLEINKIIGTSNKRTNTLEYVVILHTPVKNFTIDLLNSIDLLRDYNGNVTDHGVIEFYMGGGDFVKEIQPYRSNLEITIIENNKTEDIIKTNRYSFIITNNEDNMYGSLYTKTTQKDLNAALQVHIEGQYLLREIEAARTVYCDNVFRDATVKDVIISQFGSKLTKLKIEGSAISVNCDVREPNNDYTYRHIAIPNGTKLLSLPRYLQDTNYGVYNAGLGSYIQAVDGTPTVFVYPLYDKELFDSSEKKLIIYYSNNSNFNYVENTYRQDGDILKILAGTDIQTVTTGENDIKDTGDGFIGGNPGMLTKRNVLVTDSDAQYTVDNQIAGTKIKDREDGVVNTTYVGNDPNHYKHRTNIVRKTMCYYQIPWRFPNIDLIFPGMPVCFKYEDVDNGIIDLKGIVQSTFARYNKAANTTVGIINIMVEKPSFSKNL